MAADMDRSSGRGRLALVLGIVLGLAACEGAAGAPAPFVLTSTGGYVLSDAPPGVEVTLNSKRLLPADLRRMDRTIAAETEWSRHGITARHRCNQGRLRRLQALRTERARRTAPQGRVKLAAASDSTGAQLVIEAKGIAKRLGELCSLGTSRPGSCAGTGLASSGRPAAARPRSCGC